jgi:hypothetical protein
MSGEAHGSPACARLRGGLQSVICPVPFTLEVSFQNLPQRLLENLQESLTAIFMRMGAHLAHELLSP